MNGTNVRIDDDTYRLLLTIQYQRKMAREPASFNAILRDALEQLRDKAGAP